MTESKRASAGARAEADGGDPALLGALYGRTMMEVQKEWLVGVTRIQRDCLEFLGERMRKDIEIAKRMSACRDLEAAVELQTAFIETARDDYLEGAQRFLSLSQGLAQNCAERLAAAPMPGKPD